MTELTSQPTASRELAMEPHDEVEILVTSSSVMLRGVDRDVFRVQSLGGEDVADDFEIERLPGKVRLREITTGFKIGSLRIRTGHAPDLEIEVPRAAALSFRSLSGDVEAKGTAGESRWATASGDIRVQVDGGPVAVESMSGDVEVVATAPIELRARSVSGDLEVRGSTLRRPRRLVDERRHPGRRRPGRGPGPRDQLGQRRRGAHDVERRSCRHAVGDRRRPRHRDPVRRGRPRPPDAGRGGGHGRRLGPDDLGRHPAARRRRDGGVGADATCTPVAGRAANARRAGGPGPAGRSGRARADRRGRRGRGGPEPGPPGRPRRRRRAREDDAAEGADGPNEAEPADDSGDLEPAAARVAPLGAASPTDRREAARLEILRALERGDLDIESASHKLEILEDAGPRFFRGWC